MDGLETKSLSLEEFEEKVKPLLNRAAELIMSHPDIPEEVDQGDVLGALITVGNEMDNGLHNRVPEQVRLRDEIDKKNKQIEKLKQTNQDLFLRAGAPPKNGEPVEPQKPKLSWAEIKAKIDALG